MTNKKQICEKACEKTVRQQRKQRVQRLNADKQVEHEQKYTE